MIELTGVNKVFRKDGREARALDEFSLSVARGEFVVVRGPSGSGKTTLLLTVAGMSRPTSGKVVLDGLDVYALSLGRRARMRAEKIGFVFQMFHLVPYLTALENVLSARLAGGKARRKDALELLARVGLSDRANHRPWELSAGERQRVAVARALLNKPAVILADEPTGNLDPESGAQVMEHLAAFNRAGGTVLLVSHDPHNERYARRVVALTPPQVRRADS